MQRVVILVLILAVAGGVYYLATQDEPAGEPENVGDAGKATPKKKADEETDPGLQPKRADPVLPAPDPVQLELRGPARALLVGKRGDGWNHLVLMVFGMMRELEFRSWFLEDGGGKAGSGHGLEALSAKPTAAYLDDQDITVLVLDNLDPNALPADFWATVERRVNSGRMGLFARPSFPASGDGQGLSEHPMLTHPVLKTLLPVKSAALLSGSPVPGLFATPQSLRPTSDGHRHPATRLIAVPEVSVKAWSKATSGDGGFATKFCYPVQEARSDAQVLVNCEAATPLPAVIATLPQARARVLWMGNVDFGHRTHYVGSKNALQKILINHMLIWLVGQAQ